MQWLIVLPLEIVAAAITIDYWESPINKAVWVTLFWLLIVVINLFGVKGYGEAEFVFSMIKVIAVIGFMYVFFFMTFTHSETYPNSSQYSRNHPQRWWRT